MSDINYQVLGDAGEVRGTTGDIFRRKGRVVQVLLRGYQIDMLLAYYDAICS